MSATAIIVSYNSAAVLPSCIKALKREGIPIVVVDNQSADESVELARSEGVTVIINPKNIGFGAAMNEGVRTADSDYCLLINPDATVSPGAVQALLDTAQTHPDAVIVTPKLIEPDGREFFQPRSYLAGFLPNPKSVLHLPEAEVCVPFVSGACMLVKRDVFLTLGGFDERLFLFYEDDDLCRRVSDAGYSIIYAPNAVVHHARGKSGKQTARAIYIIRYHQAWSKCYAAHKYGLPSPALQLLFLQAGKWLVALLCMNPRKMQRHAGSVAGAWDFMRGKRK